MARLIVGVAVGVLLALVTYDQLHHGAWPC